MFRALRHRNFQLFFAGQAVSLIGTWMQNIAQGWLVYDLTHSAFWLGFIGFVGSLPALLFSLIGGAVADRVPKRPLIIFLQGVLLLLALVLGLLTAYGWVKLWHVAALGFLFGLASAFEMPARQAFIYDMVGREDLGNAIALNAAMFHGARLIGPAIAGILMISASSVLRGIGICFLVNSVSYLAVILCLSLIKVAPHKKEEGRPDVLQSTLDGLRYIRKTPSIFAVLALVGIMTIFGWSSSVLMPIFADQVLHSGPGGFARLVSCNGLGAVIAALTLAMVIDRVGPRSLSFGGIGIFCVSVVAMALSTDFWFSAACMVLTGFGLVTFFATSITTLQKQVPDHMRGRIMGIYSFVFFGFFPIASLQAGTIAHWAGAPFAVILGAVVCALAAVVAARFAPRS